MENVRKQYLDCRKKEVCSGIHYHYTGCFFEKEVWEKVMENCPGPHLEGLVPYPHITFSYEPDTVDETLFGSRVLVRITGYGKSDTNEGFLVEASSDREEVDAMIHRIPLPHITISTSPDGEAVNTRFLEFMPLAEGMEVEGVFGGIVREEERKE